MDESALISSDGAFSWRAPGRHRRSQGADPTALDTRPTPGFGGSAIKSKAGSHCPPSSQAVCCWAIPADAQALPESFPAGYAAQALPAIRIVRGGDNFSVAADSDAHQEAGLGRTSRGWIRPHITWPD